MQAERPEPEESWQDRQFDQKHRQELDLLATMVPLPIDKILRIDHPYSLPEILKGLIEASDILLHKKDYDGHGWERLEYCHRHAKEVLKLFGGEYS